MGLGDYHKKRAFARTPEPKGAKTKTAGPLTFVVQKHHASRLHYDFRLELDGTLKSWAVPKGPSMNPDDKRLAVMVEDHPLDYAGFEGLIPEGNYGAGTVVVWDRGVYTPITTGSREDAEAMLRAQLKKGHLTFVLLGEKLKGEFALIKTHGGDDHAWLLVKAGDEYATGTDILKKDRSVLTQRSMEEITAKTSNTWHSKPRGIDLGGAPKADMPHDITPMLAKSADEPFDRDDWVFEMKYDGYRAVAEVDQGSVAFYSRNGISYKKKFAPIVSALTQIRTPMVLDGEVVVVDSQGKPRFQWLQDYPDSGGDLVYYVFDIIHYDGHDLTSLSLERRKAILKAILPDLPTIRYSDHITATGKAMFARITELGLEGIMAKKTSSTYRPGVRSDEWLKIKAVNRQEVVIAGFTDPKGARNHFGALVAGTYQDGILTYAGHIGGGFDDRTLRNIYRKLQPLIRKTCPFPDIPETNAPVTWVKPTLIAEVTYSNLTKEGQMRHPVFLGLREDKDARDVESEITRSEPPLTNLDKLFWPADGYTKGDLLAYYREVSPFILPYLKDRPQSLLRYPNGITGQSFYQKDASSLDREWIETTDIHSESNDKHITYALCQNGSALLYLINLGCIDLNPWNSRVGLLDKPDYLLIDLDPLDIEFGAVVKTALAARSVLETLGIPSFVKTSGATGMHIYIPMGAAYTYEQVRIMAELLCVRIHGVVPDITSMKRNPKDRPKRVYLDYLQNVRGQTLASAYSVRARPGATVSAPITWSEVTAKLHPSQFTMKNIMRRVQKHGDLFAGALGKGIDIEKVLKSMLRASADRP